MSEPTHYKQKQEKSGDTIAENKHRKEEKQKNDFFFPPQNFREAKTKAATYSVIRSSYLAELERLFLCLLNGEG